MRSAPYQLTCAAVLAMALCAAVPASAEKTDYAYSISELKLRFDLAAESPDVRVCLDITYRIGDESKSDGFKFVGNNKVFDLKCMDERGEPLRCEALSLRETKIQWFFPETKNAARSFHVTFSLKAQVGREGAQHVFHAPWAGVFRVPVEKAVFEAVLPEGVDGARLEVRPEPWQKTEDHGRIHVITEQSPLKKQDFYIKY